MSCSISAPAPSPIAPCLGAAPCPLCGRCDAELVAEHTVPDLAPAPGHREWPTRSLAYRGCHCCGTVSQWPLPDSAELDRYYSTVRMARHVPEAAAAKKILYEDRLELLQRVTGLREGDCLEVGCGNGLLLDLIATRWGLAAHGLEPSSSYDTHPDVRIARCTLDGFSPGAVEWPAQYDLVCCRHVLEHVTDPAEFVRRLAALVKVDGWLYVEVPSSTLHARGGLPASGQNIHAVHLHHYTGPGLAATLGEHGLTVTHIEDRDVGHYPSLCVAARRGFDGAGQFRRQFDRQEARYARAAERLVAMLEAAAGAPLVVWGAGADAGQVLPLVPAAARARLRLYDRSPAKQGCTLLGVPILNDAQLAAMAPAWLVAGCGNRTLVDDIRAEAAERFPQVPVCGIFEEEGRR